ncbi:MAG: cytidylate kinase-like family protein [Chloroflexi bacterium]|nr:cytidylate kinase-like family protein [Chloroflexota bacterium]
MAKISPIAITISRQLGSGGAYLGQQLATRLNITYLDREIVYETAKKLQVSEDTIVLCDEKSTPFWRSWAKVLSNNPMGTFVPPSLNIVTDEIIHDVEFEVIRCIARETSVIVIGRGGFYVLRQHARHFSIFLHASMGFRQKRVCDLYNVSEQQARKVIESIDKERGRYLHALTGHDWNDAFQYQLCLDTSVLGLDKAQEIIMDTIRARFGSLISE